MVESQKIEKYVSKDLLEYGYELKSTADKISISSISSDFRSTSQKYYIGFLILIAITLIVTIKVIGFAISMILILVYFGKDASKYLTKNSFQISDIKELSFANSRFEVTSGSGLRIEITYENIESIYYELPYEGIPYKATFYAELADEIYEIFVLISD